MYSSERQEAESRDLPSMMEVQDLPSHNTQSTSYSSDPGSRTGDSFNGFDHQEEAHRINNASTTDFDRVQKRLETFKTWPDDSPIKPHDLAAAGFRFLGMDDQVVCFKCDLHLWQWKTGEDPWNKHKKTRPRCPFVLECESENGSEVHDSPNYPAENVGHTHVEMVSGTRIRMPSYHDPSGVPYSERPLYVTQGGEYGYHEQPYVNRHPADVQTGYHDQQVYYPGRTQEFLGRDPRLSQFQRPEHQRMGTEITRHVVVNSGSSQVHIVGSGAAFYQLHPQDKLAIQCGSQGHPQQVRPVRDLTSMYPEANQTSRFPAVSYAPSYAGPFAKKPRYENPVEEGLSEGTVEFRSSSVSHNTGLHQGGGRSAKDMQYQGRSHSEEQVEYMNTVHETSAPNQPPFPQKAPETFYEPCTTEKKVSNEDRLVQENCYRPQQRYPGTKSEMRETNPYSPPLETSRWQDPGQNDPPFAVGAQWPLRYMYEVGGRSAKYQGWIHSEEQLKYMNTVHFPFPQTAPPYNWDCIPPLHYWDPTDTPWGEHQKWKHQWPLVFQEHAPRQRATSQERFTTPQEAYQYRRPQQTHGLNDRQTNGPITKPKGCEVVPHAGCCKDGKDRKDGQNGKDGRDGVNGKDGRDGRDGTSKGKHHLRNSHSGKSLGEKGEAGMPGQDGNPGIKGEKGEPGIGGNSGNVSRRRKVPIRSGDPPVLGTSGRSQSFPVAKVSNVVRPQTLPLDQQQPHWQTQPVSTSQKGRMTSALQSGSSGAESGSSQDRRSCSPRGSTALEFDTKKFLEMKFTQQQINDTISSTDLTDLVSAILEREARQPANQTCPQPTHQRCESGEESLEEKLERMKEERMCKICMDAELGVVFHPCGHLTCCANCANGMDFCPICRAPIQEKTRTFFS